MSKKCWICEKNDADSGEHVILKSVLDKIAGKPKAKESRFVSYVAGKSNIPVKSFKNKHFKFNKSICRYCNNTLTQPYDDAFRHFVDKLWASKSTVIYRSKFGLPKISSSESQNLALYLIKILGCLIIEYNGKLTEKDHQLFRHSLLYGKVLTENVFFCMHRDLEKQSAKSSATVAQYSLLEDKFILWTIDLDWISIVLSYPFAPPRKYGSNWQLGDNFPILKLGKLK